jgi:DNA-binding HxlR family transcriptional regulator
METDAPMVCTHGVNRFSALRRHIPAVTSRVLTQQLRELETDGLIERTIVSSRPLHVTYVLTRRGEELVPILAALNTWASNEQKVSSGCHTSPEAA